MGDDGRCARAAGREGLADYSGCRCRAPVGRDRGLPDVGSATGLVMGATGTAGVDAVRAVHQNEGRKRRLRLKILAVSPYVIFTNVIMWANKMCYLVIFRLQQTGW